MDNNEAQIAASETLDAILGKVEKRDDAAKVVEMREVRKNGG